MAAQLGHAPRRAHTSCLQVPATMVRVGQFELAVLVGGKPLAEMTTAAGETYVETQFNTPVSYKVTVKETDPYGEAFTQQWPVTPYTLRIMNHTGDPASAAVYVDGSLAARQIIHAGSNEVKGFKDSYMSDAEYKEFVFTLPRRVRSTENAEPDFNDEERQALKKQLESIRVEIFEAKFQSSETRVMGHESNNAGMDAVNKAVAKAASAASASAAGKSLGGMAHGRTKVNLYTVGTKVVCELVMRYSQRQKLENIGLLSPQSASGAAVAYAVPRSRKQQHADAAGGAGGGDEDVKPDLKKLRAGDDAIDLS